MSRKTRKLMWSVPLIAAVAVIGALAMFMTLTPNDAAAQTEEEVPGVPMNLTAKGISPTSIELEWDPPMDGDGGSPDSYRIDYSEDGLVWYSLDPSYDSTLYTDDDGLSANEMRYYRVFAVNSTGSSDVLGPEMGTTMTSDKPDAIEDLRASIGPNAQKVPPVEASTDPPQAGTPEEEIDLLWTAPDDPDGAPVTEYRIQVSKDGRSYRNLTTKSAAAAGCAGGGECSHTQDELLESTDRWYRVYAINKIGESDGSNAPMGSTALGRAPAEVPEVRAGLNPAGEIFLYWDAPVTDDAPPVADEPPGAPILGYYIQGKRGADAAVSFDATGDDVAPSEDNLFPVSANTDVPITAAVQAKLDPDGTGDFWAFRVIAANRVVDRNLEDGNLNLDGNADATVDTTSVLAFNAIQEDTDDTTADALLDKPSLKVIRDTNNVGGRISLILEWQVDDAVAGTTYRIEHSEDLVDWELLIAGGGVTDGTPADDDYENLPRPDGTEPDDPHQGRHINLVAGETHYYRIFADHPRTDPELDDDVFTEASNSVSGTTTAAAMPDPPDLTDIFETSETVIRMGWLPPGKSTTDDAATATTNPSGIEAVGYGRITGYLVEYSHDGTAWMDLVTIGNKLDKLYSYNNKTKKLTEKDGIATDHKMWFEHTNLYQDQTVHYRISTINNASARIRMSDTSDAESDTTDKALASDDPGGLVVKPRSDMSIMLMWNARADDIHAAPITGYKIESSPLDSDGDCAEDWSTVVEDTMSETTAYTHMGLDPETGMCYRVFGINVVATSTSFVGYGDAYITTNDNDAIATTGEQTNATPMAEGMIDPVTVTVGGAPETMDVSMYFSDAEGDTLTYMAMSDMEMYATAMISGSMLTITAVAEGSATVTVTATDADGSGMSAMQEIMVTVEPAPMELMPPSNVIRDPVGSGIVRVDWDAVAGADGYYVIAVAPGDPTDFATAVLNYPPGTTLRAAVDGLTRDQVYNVFVVAFGAAGNAVSDIRPITAE